MEHKKVEFLKIQRLKGGNMCVEYHKNNEHNTKTKEAAMAHDALVWFDKLRMHLIRTYGLLGKKSMAALDELNSQESAYLAYLKENVQCTGVTLRGSDAGGSALVSGTLTTILGKKVALNTPLISFGSQDYAFAGDMQTECEALVREAYEYVFNNKTAAPTLVGEDGSEIGDEPKSTRKKNQPAFVESPSAGDTDAPAEFTGKLEDMVKMKDGDIRLALEGMKQTALRTICKDLGIETAGRTNDGHRADILKAVRKARKNS